MKYLAEKTGGIVVTQESFASEVFRETYRKLFDRDANGFLKMGYAAKMDVFVSRELRVQGSIGPCISLKKSGPMVAETAVGEGGTTSWYLGGMDRNSTLALMLDLAPALKDANTVKYGYVQCLTNYRHSSGRQHLRVTTMQRRFADPNNMYELAVGFDQEAATALMARLGILKTEQEEPIEVLKWLDRSLIRLVWDDCNTLFTGRTLR